MSSNTTHAPGMNDGADFQDFYSRGHGASQRGQQGTVVPGMNIYAPEVEKRVASTGNNLVDQKVPVVGFLYSISRQGFGEFWPLHIGSNKIGRSSECDICLKEATVSELHAALNIKQLKSTKKILASIRDEGSKNGIYVNDEELDYDAHEVKNHDLITIGDNYIMLVILIDAEEMGLRIAENFQPTEENEIQLNINDTGRNEMTDPGAFYNPANRVENGTVSLDGTNGVTSGRTKFL